METNKEEAVRCLRIAKNQYGSKNYEAAVRLTNKSINLFPTDEAKEFLVKAEKAAASNPASNPASSGSTPTTEAPSSPASDQNKEAPKAREKPSASQQNAEVREILSCGTDYYKVLKVDKKCTEVEIKRSYRKVRLVSIVWSIIVDPYIHCSTCFSLLSNFILTKTIARAPMKHSNVIGIFFRFIVPQH